MIIVRLRRVAVSSCIISFFIVLFMYKFGSYINILVINININDIFIDILSPIKNGIIGFLSFIFFGSVVSTFIKILVEVDTRNNLSIRSNIKNNFKVLVGIFKKNIITSFYNIYFIIQFVLSTSFIVGISLFFDKKYDKYFDRHYKNEIYFFFLKYFDINFVNKMFFLLSSSSLILCFNFIYLLIIIFYLCVACPLLRTRKNIGDHS